MKYIGAILLFFSFLFLGAAENCAIEVQEVEKTNVQSFGQENGYYTSEEELPVLYGIEQNAGGILSSFRLNWAQVQQSIIERTVMGLKRIICLASSRDTMLIQQQYALFNHSFLFSEKPCSLYYVYAIRHILI